MRPALGSGKVMLVTCDAELLMWRRGDTAYNPSRNFFPTGDPVDLTLTVTFFGGQAYLDHRRRRAAEAGAVRKWCHLVGARLSVSAHDIYLGMREGAAPIFHADTQEVQLIATGEIVIAAANASGSVRLKIRARWAELALILWSVRHMPEYPQLAGRTWIPGDWLVHATAHGYDVDTTP